MSCSLWKNFIYQKDKNVHMTKYVCDTSRGRKEASECLFNTLLRIIPKSYIDICCTAIVIKYQLRSNIWCKEKYRDFSHKLIRNTLNLYTTIQSQRYDIMIILVKLFNIYKLHCNNCIITILYTRISYFVHYSKLFIMLKLY